MTALGNKQVQEPSYQSRHADACQHLLDSIAPIVQEILKQVQDDENEFRMTAMDNK